MLGLGTSLIQGGSALLTYIKDGLKLYMPYNKDAVNKGTQFVGTGSTSFDGDDYIDCGDDTSLDITSAITLSMWVKPNAVNDQVNPVGRDDGTNRNYYMYFDTGDAKAYWYMYISGASKETSSTSDMVVGEWMHICGTYDGASQKLYINGVFEDEMLTTGSIDNDDVSFSIGAREAGADRFFDGSMKNVAIWERALTATEVQNVMYKSYAEVSGRLTDGLVSWWSLDAGSLGSDLSDNNCAVSDGLTEADATTGWDGYDGSALTSVSTNPYSGSYHFHCVGSGSSTRVGASSTVSGLGTGKRYQVVAYVKSSDITNVSFRMDGSSFSETTSLVADTWTRISTIWDADDGNVLIVITSVSHEDALKSIDIDNVSIKEISTEDLKGSNDGEIFGAVIDEDLYGSDTPVKPRAIDNAPTVQANAIGSGSANFVGSSSQYIDMGDVLDLGTEDFSITAWCKCADWDDFVIMGKFEDSNDRWKFQGKSENPPVLNFYHVKAGSAETNYSGTTSLDNHKDVWTHIALTSDRSGKIIGYINGVKDAADVNSDAASLDNAGNLHIGRFDSLYSTGNICQAGIWKGVLTQEKIQSIMEKTFEELDADDKEPTGEELITNGDFSSALGSEWTIEEAGGGSVELSSGQLLFTQGSNSQFASQSFTTAIGTQYVFKVDLVSSSITKWNSLRVGESNKGTDNYNSGNIGRTQGTQYVFFTATATTTWITIEDAQSSSSTSLWDNVSVKEGTHDLVSYWALDESVPAVKFVQGSPSEWINIPIAGTSILSSDFSLGFWINADSGWNSYWGGVWMNSSTTGSSTYLEGFLLAFGRLLYGQADGGGGFTSLGHSLPSYGEWHYKLLTYDESSKLLTIYVDGVSAATSTASYSLEPADRIRIGTAGYGTHFSASKLAIWDRTLTSSEALDIFNNGISSDVTSVVSSNLTGYWKLDNASSFPDSVGSNNGAIGEGTPELSGAILDKTSNNNDGVLR